MVATSVGITFRLTEFAVRNFNRIDASIRRTEKAAEGGTGSLKKFDVALTGLAAGGIVSLGLAAKEAADLEDALARLATVTRSNSQSISGALQNAEKSARKFATQFSASATEVISAQFQIATAGIAVEEQVAATQGAFKLAQATVGDFTQTAMLLGQFLNTFGKNIELGYLDPMTKVQRITDVLSQTVQRFQATLPVLAQGFKFIIGPAAQLNLKLEEVAVSLGLLNTAGFKGTLAGTALSNMFNKLARARDKLDLDASEFEDFEGNLTSIPDFLRAINRALADTGPLEGQLKLIEVFDIRAGRVIKTLADNADQLEKTAAAFELASGATEKMSTVIETTTSKSLRQFGNSVQNIGTLIGGVINDGLRPFVRALTRMLNALAAIIAPIKGIVTVLASVAIGLGLAAAAALAYSAASAALGGIIASTTAAIITYTISVWASIVATTAATKQILGLNTVLVLTSKGFKTMTVAMLTISALITAFKLRIRALALEFIFVTRLMGLWTASTIFLNRALAALGFGAVKAAIMRLSLAISTYILQIKLAIAFQGKWKASLLVLGGALKFVWTTLKLLGTALLWVVRVLLALAAAHPVIALITALAAGLAYLFFWTGESADEIDKLNKKLADIQRASVDAGKNVRNFARDLSLLGKSVRLGIDIDLDNFGDNIIATTAKKIQSEFGGSTSDALKKSFDKIGTTGIFEQITEKLLGKGGNKQIAEKLISDLQASFASARSVDLAIQADFKLDDKIPDSLKQIISVGEQASKTAQFLAASFNNAKRAIFGDTQEISDFISRILEKAKSFETISKLDIADEKKLEAQKFLLEDLFKSFGLIKSSQPFRGITKELEDLGVVTGIEGDALELFVERALDPADKLNNVMKRLTATVTDQKNRIAELAAIGFKIPSTYDQIAKTLKRVRVNTDRLDGSLADFEQGILTSAVAVPKLNGFINSLKRDSSLLGTIIENTTKEIANFKKQSGGQLTKETIKALDDLVRQIKSLDGTRAKIQVTTDTQNIKKDIIAAFENLTGFDFGSVIGKSIRSNADAIKTPLAAAIGGAISSAQAASQIRNAMRKLLIDQALTQIAPLFASKINDAFTKGLVGVQGKIIDLLDPVKLKLDQGDFEGAINQAGIAVQKIGDSFNMSVKLEEATQKAGDLEKQMNKIAIAGLTASSGEAALLRSLADTLNSTVGSQRISELQTLIRRANSLGATGAQKEAEVALQRELDNRTGAIESQAQIANNVAKNVSQASEQIVSQSQIALNNFTTAANTISATLSPVFDKFLQAAELLSQTVGGETSISKSNEINFDFSKGNTEFNIEITGSGSAPGQFLEEQEIGDIIQKTRSELENDMNEKLRDLEERLRDGR